MQERVNARGEVVAGIERVAGVEPLGQSTSLPGDPPAHDTHYPDDFTLAAAAWCQHFRLCFFCHYGDRYTEDHFCEEGRELSIAVHDEWYERGTA